MAIESTWFVEIYAEFRRNSWPVKKDLKNNFALDFLEIFNCCHGVIHLYMFVCQPKVTSIIWKKIRKPNKVSFTGLPNLLPGTTESSESTKNSGITNTTYV